MRWPGAFKNMTKNERKRLIKAIDALERNPCEWEAAMAGLCALAGLEYRDPRKIAGAPISLAEVMTGMVPQHRNHGG